MTLQNTNYNRVQKALIEALAQVATGTFTKEEAGSLEQLVENVHDALIASGHRDESDVLQKAKEAAKKITDSEEETDVQSEQKINDDAINAAALKAVRDFIDRTSTAYETKIKPQAKKYADTATPVVTEKLDHAKSAASELLKAAANKLDELNVKPKSVEDETEETTEKDHTEEK